MKSLSTISLLLFTAFLNIHADMLDYYSMAILPATIQHNTYQTTENIASMQPTIIEVAGKSNDVLTITIPKLPFGEAEDLSVGFKLFYTKGSHLPSISIDTDIEFDTAVTFQLRSDSFTDDTAFVYHGVTQDYRIPFIKEGNIYTAKVTHFSHFSYGDIPTSFAEATEAIETGLANLKTSPGDNIYGLDSNIVGDIAEHINILERLEPALEHTYWDQLFEIINEAVEKWLAKMKTKSISHWNGYCIHSEFREFVTQLVQTMTELELMGSNYIIDTEVQNLINSHMATAYDEWFLITPPSACNTSNMIKYIECAVKFLTEAELGGYNGSLTEMEEKIPKYVENNIIYLLSNATCANLECLKFYLAMSQKNEFEYMGIGHDYTQELQAKVDEIEEKIKNDTCEPPLWKFYTHYSSYLGSGSMTIKKFPIDLENLDNSSNGSFVVFVSNDYASYEEGTTISYSGLEYDDGLAPLLVGYETYFSKNILEFSALIYAFGNPDPYQIGSGFATGMTCDGTLDPQFRSKVEAGEEISWTAPGDATCTFTFTPCTNEACD